MAELSLLLLQTLNQISVNTEKGRRAGRGGGGGGCRAQLLRGGHGDSLLSCTALPPLSPLLLTKLGLDPNQPFSDYCSTRSLAQRFPHHPSNHFFTEIGPGMDSPDLIFLSNSRVLFARVELDHFVPQTYLALSTRVELDTSTTTTQIARRTREQKQESEEGDDFYANLGSAIRTLREETPHVFYKDLTYEIYRDDITFRDRRNTFTGIDNYKLMFWSLRFHARMFFKTIWVEVLRIWQPSDRVIVVRWAVRGIPRVPWNAQGLFEGTSEYKLDKNGKIYEHKVDNVARNQPPFLRTPDVLRLLSRAPCVTPTPTFFERVPLHTWMISLDAMDLKCFRISLDNMDQHNRSLAVCLLVRSQLV